MSVYEPSEQAERTPQKYTARVGGIKKRTRPERKRRGEEEKNKTKKVSTKVPRRRHLRHPRKIKPATALDCSIQTNLAGKL